ncbi:PAS domain-containing protein [Streptacidiphilus albus]|uniref:PAS domain-containing protein n=1 Tax=Streptacidiphilus albus TaxID=105425 RepID=UPI000689AA2B|nr:PAS domain-containing protein [Streptacidiphilus albus]
MSHSFDADPPTATDVDEAVLAAVFSQFPSGLHILDTRLRFLRFNSAAQHNERFSLEGAIGRPLGEVLRRFDIDDTTVLTAERLARQVLATGEPARGFLVHVRLFSDRHAEMVASISWFRLQDPGGRVLGVAAVITDITEQHRAQERLRLLDRAGARIGTTLGIVRTAQELAEALVPDLADLATVDLLDPVLGGEAAVPGASVEQLPLRRVGHRAAEGPTAPGPTPRPPPGRPGPAARRSAAGSGTA